MNLITLVLLMGSMKNTLYRAYLKEHQGFIFTVLYVNTLKGIFIESSSLPSIVEMDEDDLT